MTARLRSSIGRKAVMAVSGAFLFLFVLGHMLGNLKLFSGIDPMTQRFKIDVYADWLREIGYPALSHGQFLWMARIGLIAIVLAHFFAAISVTLHNKRARPVNYSHYAPAVTSYAARTMIWGGIIIVLFIVYHLAHLTFGLVGPAGFKHGSVHDNLILAFSNSYLVAIYLVGQVALCFHLYHGVWSMFQSLGLTRPASQCILRGVAKAAAFLIFAGYASVPLSIYFGFVR